LNKKRLSLLLLAFNFIFCVLILRLFYFQIIEGPNLSKSASVQRIKDSNVEKPRGNIVDRNDIPLTNRSKKFSLVLKPLYLKESEEDLLKICEVLGLDYEKIKKDLISNRGPILIECDEKSKDTVLSLKIPGISSISSLKRYDENSLARHVIGYLNKADRTGEFGVEKYYEDVLNYDQKNSVGVVTDAKRNPVEGLGYRMIRLEGTSKKLDVKLTLDYHIQKITEEVMERNGIKGAVVIEDVISGDIVAMASKPDFDQNNVQDYLNSSDNELFNRAVASYNLGSIFKIIDAALMFELNISTDEHFYCPGYIYVGNKMFKCSSYGQGGHGEVDYKKAFALSCNSYFIDLGLKMGYRNLVKMAERFGLGATTGIKEQGIHEASGNLPDPQRYYSGGDIANISIGQGEIMATPIQVANIVATIANGGIKNQVNIVDSIIDENGNKVRDLRNKRGERIISKDISDTIKSMMEEVTIAGTGTRANLEKYGGAAGKTGSAETSRSDIVHAWFAGYFPKDNPKYSLAVFVENGQNGGKVAAPIFAEIAEQIMEKGW